MRRYVGNGEYIPGVPAADLTEAEWKEHVAAVRLVETVDVEEVQDDGSTKTVTRAGPAMALWKKERDPPAGKAGAGAGASADDSGGEG